MTKAFYLLILLALSTLPSCLIRNATKKADTNKCDIHNIKMHKTIVRIVYGYGCPLHSHIKPGYHWAKSKVCGGCNIRPYKFVIVYHCRQCDKLKKDDKKYWADKDKECKVN